jgi:hypothetical protein
MARAAKKSRAVAATPGKPAPDKPRPPAARRPAATVRLPRVSKGRRPEFYENPAVDQLFAIVTALTAEVSVVFDRLDALERVLVRDGTLAGGALEAFLPDAAAAAERSQRRAELVARVFAVLEAYAERTAARIR